METYIYNKAAGGPVILWGMHMHTGDEMDSLISALEKLIPDKAYTLAAFDPEDWDAAFSPWKAICDGRKFSGKGGETLSWLKEEYIPFLDRTYPDASERFIAGYSLAGLFALWTMYESDLFGGAASCSGSLWYPGWDKYISEHVMAPESRVYLSLGGKEKNSKSPLVSQVENRTRFQYDLLKRQLRKAVLEMNPGGHFSDIALRTAKGIAGLTEE